MQVYYREDWNSPKKLKYCKNMKNNCLTTRNSVLSTRSFPSVSNMLNAIWKPVLGSENNILREFLYLVFNLEYKLGDRL